MQNEVKPPVNSAFIKATIKIAHPDWTPEQIEAEYQMKIQQMNNPNNSDDGCEFCSS